MRAIVEGREDRDLTQRHLTGVELAAPVCRLGNRMPPSADFRFSNLRKVMAYFGYLESNKGATSGSLVKFYHPETKAVLLLHKPHLGDEMTKAAVDSVVKFLKEHGQI